MRRLPLLASLFGLSGVVLALAQGANPPGAPDDHFLGYRTKVTRGAPKFAKESAVPLVDDFESGAFDLASPADLFVPADVNGAGIVDPATHLTAYRIRAVKGAPKHVKRTRVAVTNQLGTLLVDTVKPELLLVPSSKSLSAPPPTPGENDVDHFKCYRVKVSKRTPAFAKTTARLVDALIGTDDKVFEILRPVHLCLPVDKRAEGIKNRQGSLLCYQVKQAKGQCAANAPLNAGGACKAEPHCGGTRRVTSFCVTQAKHEKRVGEIRIANQLGSLALDTIRESELCVPSVLGPGGPTPTTSPVPTPTPADTTPTPTPSATPEPTDCGNGVADVEEVCDGSDLRGSSCATLGYGAGSLGCLPSCAAFDTGACVVEAIVPPDPASVAPPVNLTVPSDLLAESAFLYEGPNPIQTGVVPGTIAAQRVVVLRGRVIERGGGAVPGVRVAVLDHPEYGETRTRADGAYDLVVNGGGQVRLTFVKLGYLGAQRGVAAPWRDYVTVPDVALVPLDTAVTEIALGATGPMQVARGSAVTDADGSRQATVLVPPGVSAQLELPGGGVIPVSTLRIRATEYTVGADGPAAMPAELPATTGYTYAVELGADEAMLAGADTVRFSSALPFYVENFLGFPTGTSVPAGYYDRRRGVWVASENGRVIEIVGVVGGRANLDVDGDAEADADGVLAALGITEEERERLAELYAAGSTLWRVPITHFTPWDCNWGIFPPPGATPPNVQGPGGASTPPQNPGVTGSPPNSPQPSGDKSPLDGPDQACGSVIDCQNQTLRERIALAGSAVGLNYSSERVEGRTASRTLTIPVSGSSVPADVLSLALEISVAGRTFTAEYPPNPNLVETFVWDGEDAYGRSLIGWQRARVRVGHVYRATYQTPEPPSRFGYNGNGVPITGSFARSELTLWQEWVDYVGRTDLRAAPDGSPGPGIGGWTLDVHHVYDPDGRTLYLGNGTTEQAVDFGVIAGDLVRAWPPSQTDLNPYTVLGGVSAFTSAPDGSLYAATTGSFSNFVFWRSPDGTVSERVAGVSPQSSGGGFSGDGGPALLAQFNSISGLAVAPDGALLVSDSGNHRVRRIGTDGIVTTIAGSGPASDFSLGGYGGDGGPATEALLSIPTTIAVDSAGNVYINDMQNARIRRITTDGIITTLAGTGQFCQMSSPTDCGEGGQASSAGIGLVIGLAVGPDDSVYIGDAFNSRVRRITPDGIIRTVAGGRRSTTANDPCGDGGPALDACFVAVRGVAVAPDGSVFVGDNTRARRVSPDGTIQALAGGSARQPCTTTYDCGAGGPARAADLIALTDDIHLAPSGNLMIAKGWQIEPTWPGLLFGNVLLASRDGREIYEMSNTGRHLRTLSTLTGATLWEFDYDAAGRLVAARDGDGNTLTLVRDGTGEVTEIRAPFGQRTVLTYDADGYLASVTNPAGERYDLEYSPLGLLTAFTDPRRNTTSYGFDDRGLLVSTDDAGAGSQTFSRSQLADGWAIERDTALGRLTRYEVENLAAGGHRRSTRRPDGTEETRVVEGDGRSTTTTSDGTQRTITAKADPRFGLQSPLRDTQATTPAGLRRTVEHERTVALADPRNPLSLTSLTDTVSFNGRVFTTSYAAASRTFTTVSPEGRTSSRSIDAQGRVLSSRIGDLLPVTRTYDAHGRLATLTSGEGADARVTSFAYDADGFLERLTDPESRSTSFERDPLGRVTREVHPDGRATVLTYDANGNIASITPPGRPAHSFSYTARNELAEYVPPDVGIGATATSYAYDPDRQIDSVTQPDGETVAYGYDPGGRLASVTSTRGTVTYAYETGTGRLERITTPEGNSLALGYDGALVTSTTWAGAVAGSVSRQLDDEFRPTSIAVAGGATIGIGYDDDGRVEQAGSLGIVREPLTGLVATTALDDVRDERLRNEFGELESYAASSSGGPLFAEELTRDKLGRITNRTQTAGGVTKTYAYGYDLAGRLVEVAEDGAPTVAYDYDDNGNRRARMVGGAAVSAGVYDDQDRMLSYGGATYEYAASGELRRKVDGGDVTTYGYDAFGNLVTVELPDGRSVEYVIDGRNRRIGKRVDGVPVQGFLYLDQLRPAAELDGAGNVVATFVYATGRNVPDYMIKGGVEYRIVTDHLGSPRVVVDSTSGSVVQEADYDEFGIVATDTNPGFQPFGFAGGLYDADTRLIRFGARDYDPESGRWTSKDPIGFEARDTNLFAYALGDPVNRIDPNGQFVGLDDYLLVTVLAGTVLGLGVAISPPLERRGLPDLFGSEPDASLPPADRRSPGCGGGGPPQTPGAGSDGAPGEDEFSIGYNPTTGLVEINSNINYGGDGANTTSVDDQQGGHYGLPEG